MITIRTVRIAVAALLSLVMADATVLAQRGRANGRASARTQVNHRSVDRSVNVDPTDASSSAIPLKDNVETVG